MASIPNNAIRASRAHHLFILNHILVHDIFTNTRICDKILDIYSPSGAWDQTFLTSSASKAAWKVKYTATKIFRIQGTISVHVISAKIIPCLTVFHATGTYVQVMQAQIHQIRIITFMFQAFCIRKTEGAYCKVDPVIILRTSESSSDFIGHESGLS